MAQGSAAVRPIRPERRPGRPDVAEVAGSKSEPLKLEAEGCPDRCVCFESIVRCMFLRMKKVPEVPANTTNL
jgi:hypothetical protein